MPRNPRKPSPKLSIVEIRDLRTRRVRAIRRAYPQLDAVQCVDLIGRFYRGKPGTGRVYRILVEAGLL